MDRIRVIPLGTSAGTPTRERNLASYAIALDGHLLLVDCGEGTQHQLMKSQARSGQLEAIFITHLHGDHLYGLPGLLATLGMQGRQEPLPIYGPPGIDRYLNATIQATHLWIDFTLEIQTIEPGNIRAVAGYRVAASALDHRVETFGFAIVEDDRPGKFDVIRAIELGVPEGPLYAKLQGGENVTLPNGVAVKSADVVGPKRTGRRVVYCTDTRPCSNAVDLARGADLLIHESTYDESLIDEARERGHSTARQAATIALQAGAKRLLLTHFSPRYAGGDVSLLVREAQDIFAHAEAAEELREIEL
ncbi:MAG TPA: ribonuclease Z [Thermoanaerobaculia bacterium]